MTLKEFESRLERLGLTDLKDLIIDFLVRIFCAGKRIPYSKVWHSRKEPREEVLIDIDEEVLNTVSQLGLVQVSRKCHERSANWTLYEMHLTESAEEIASEAVENRIQSKSDELAEVLREYPQTLLKILSDHMIIHESLHDIPVGWAFMEVPPLLSKVKKDPTWYYGKEGMYTYEVEWILEKSRIRFERIGLNLDSRENLEKYFWIAVSWHPIFRQQCESLLKRLVNLGFAAFKSLYTTTCHNYSDAYIIPPQLVSFIKKGIKDYNKPSREMLAEFVYMILLTKALKKITRDECLNILRLLDLTEKDFSEYLETLHAKKLTSCYDMLASMTDQPFTIQDQEGLMNELNNRFRMMVSLILTK